jgi:predicted enzyme related to lactoylglutathione lyase
MRVQFREMSTPENSCPPTHSIAWNELITPAPAAAIRFYSEMFGWTTEAFPKPGGDYTMFKHGEKIFGGVMAPPQPGIPPHWLNYVNVADLDAALAKATSLGAKVCMGPMDIGSAGRIAIINDPQGAGIGLHETPKA